MPSAKNPQSRHEWRTKTPDGRKRLIRAVRQGNRWRLQARFIDRGATEEEAAWFYYDPPRHPARPEDLEELIELLDAKYRRRRLAWEDVELARRQLQETLAKSSPRPQAAPHEPDGEPDKV